jgi:RHS repeat-associated protein
MMAKLKKYQPENWNNNVPAYLFNAKELDEESGMYYFEARYMKPPMFIQRDPKFERYPHLSPYSAMANSPLRYVDPTGEEVEADKTSQQNIKNTLTKQEAKFVRFDGNGRLDEKRLSKSKSDSENMTALKTLAKSETLYKFSVAEKDLQGAAFHDKGEGKNFYYGVTQMPNNEDKPSPDNDVYIITWNKLSEEKQVENTAHEAYGHAYFYELKQQGQNVNVNHTRTAELNENGECCIFVPSNHALENQIKKVTNQARTNYQSRKK